jgi:hypothetical protein
MPAFANHDVARLQVKFHLKPGILGTAAGLYCEDLEIDGSSSAAQELTLCVTFSCARPNSQ